jgi:hypothetical protein
MSHGDVTARSRLEGSDGIENERLRPASSRQVAAVYARGATPVAAIPRRNGVLGVHSTIPGL